MLHAIVPNMTFEIAQKYLILPSRRLTSAFFLSAPITSQEMTVNHIAQLRLLQESCELIEEELTFVSVLLEVRADVRFYREVTFATPDRAYPPALPPRSPISTPLTPFFISSLATAGVAPLSRKRTRDDRIILRPLRTINFIGKKLPSEDDLAGVGGIARAFF